MKVDLERGSVLAKSSDLLEKGIEVGTVRHLQTFL